MAFHITEACIGCTACARLCPVFAISGEKGKQHAVNEKRCVGCGVCGRTCPKAAIIDSSGNLCIQVKRNGWPKPVIDQELCSACGICVNDCTAEALSISLPVRRGDTRVYAELIAPQKCVGCAICRNHCPLGAITMPVTQAIPPAPEQTVKIGGLAS
jgi:Pyruvate/2-oxoacid:ferredoxin oxidoreductase delta subunit